MNDILVCARLEVDGSFEDPIFKLIRIKVGMSYESFLNEIRSRFDLDCDPQRLMVMFAAKCRADMLMPISDSYEVGGFLCGIESGFCNPAIKVIINNSELGVVGNETEFGDATVTDAGTDDVRDEFSHLCVREAVEVEKAVHEEKIMKDKFSH